MVVLFPPADSMAKEPPEYSVRSIYSKNKSNFDSATFESKAGGLQSPIVLCFLITLDDCRNALQVERVLGDEATGSALNRSIPVFRQIIICYNNNWYVLTFSLYLSGKLNTILIW